MSEDLRDELIVAIAVGLIILFGAALASGQQPSNLQAGDLILATSCRGGFVAVTGSARPGVNAPSVTEGAGPTFALGTGSAVHAAVGLSGHVWCRAVLPSNLQTGDIILSASCRGGFDATLVSPGIAGRNPSGPPLSAGGAAAAAVSAAGKVWCRVGRDPANLQDGDVIPRTDCRDWRPVTSAPFVPTSRMERTQTGYNYANTADLSISVSGGLWCEL